MEKIFRVPDECRNLNSYFWELKQNACEELEKNGISEEPSKISFQILQKICSENPKGSLATYVLELKKVFRMNKNELFSYDQKINQHLNSPVILSAVTVPEKADWDPFDDDLCEVDLDDDLCGMDLDDDLCEMDLDDDFCEMDFNDVDSLSAICQ